MENRVFYGWWIVLAAFMIIFFSFGIIYYGFPVFYPSLTSSLGFTRAQAMQGFLIGFVGVALCFGLVAGILIDRLGARQVIRVGIWFVGLSLILMGRMSRLWQYYGLCVTEVIGYTLAGPIPNQVLISNWFQAKRGRAMGYAYLGLGLGGATAPLLVNTLIERFTWRRAFEIIGLLILVVLFPVVQWVTRSTPADLGLIPDGAARSPSELLNVDSCSSAPEATAFNSYCAIGDSEVDVRLALRTRNFWLILVGTTLSIGAIGTVSQHLIFFLRDQAYSPGFAARVASGVLFSSLLGRLTVGYFADRCTKKNITALFYCLMALCIPSLFLARFPVATWGFALAFGFTMGADYMLIPLVIAECFGLRSLGKLLALTIMGYSLGQWLAPWLAGRIFDAYHSYDLVWGLMTVAGLLGSVSIYAVSPRRYRP